MRCTRRHSALIQQVIQLSGPNLTVTFETNEPEVILEGASHRTQDRVHNSRAGTRRYRRRIIKQDSAHRLGLSREDGYRGRDRYRDATRMTP